MAYSITEFERLYTGNVVRCMRLAISLVGNDTILHAPVSSGILQ